MTENKQLSRLTKDEGGTYHWAYRLPMFRNFSILFTLLKAMGICFLGVFIVLTAVLIFNSGAVFDSLRQSILITLFIVVIALVLSVVCYFLVAALYGGNYIAIYSMNEDRIIQRQPAGQEQKNKAIAFFAALSGALANNPGVTIGGLAGAANTIVVTDFKSIRSLKIIPGKGEIRVHSFLTWYTVYVHPEDFEYVAEYMASRSKKARIIRR